MDINEALTMLDGLSSYIATCPKTCARERASEAVAVVSEELKHLREYVGCNNLRSDYQSVDDMRKNLEHLEEKVRRLEWGIESDCAMND